MVKLHLVGFTTDLRNLIFATRRGAKRGGYIMNLDNRLLRTLEEVNRLDNEARNETPAAEPAKPPAPVRPASSLSPKQIQALLREGKSEEQIAKLAETDVAWIRRFTSPILAERGGVIESVLAGTIVKSRLGSAGAPVGVAIRKNLESKNVAMDNQTFDDGWKAIRKGPRWLVSFSYLTRGRRKVARFSFDPENRRVEALNDVAAELAWAPPLDDKKAKRRRPGSGSAQAARAAAKPKLKLKPKPKGEPKTNTKGKARTPSARTQARRATGS